MITNLDVILDSAYSHALAGRYSEAIRNYQAALSLDPKNVNAHYDLRLAYRDTNQIQLAFQELDKVAGLSPGDSGIYAARASLYDLLAISKNASALQEIISRLPSDAENREIFLGLLAYQQEEYRQALEHFEDAFRQQPDSAYIQGYIGRTLISLGRNSEAQKILITLARDKRVRSTELYNLAVAEKNLRNYAATVPALKRAVQLDETYYKALTMLASIEWRLGHWRSAWRHFRQAVKWSPEVQAHRQRTTASG